MMISSQSAGIFAIASLMSTVSATVCKTSDPVPAQAKEFVMENVYRGSIEREISGTITPLNGCLFKMSDFNISPPCVGTYFYGISARDGSYLPRLGLGALGSVVPQINQTFSLMSQKWSDMKGIGVYCENEGEMLLKTVWIPDVPKSDASSITKSSAALLGSAGLLAFML